MPFRFSRIRIFPIVLTIAVALVAFGRAPAQSIDVRFPTPVDRNEIVGSIAARDIGDARLTDHFYTFNGLPGDILITVDSKNLNGDFDVFTAGELRPLLKVVVYAENSSGVTKNIYLRRPESLILRVEARTPNDDEGTYRIHFNGTFAPVERSLAENQPEETSKSSRSTDRKTTRVNSAGARIYEPVETVAAAPTPEPTAAERTEEASTKPAKVTPPRNTRVRRPAPAPRRTTAKPAEGDTATAAAAKKTNKPTPVEETNPVETANPSTTSSARTTTTRRTPARSTRGSARAPKPVVTAENGQLHIEIKDGTRLQYAMSSIARVTIENGEVVIVGNDGYTKKVPLSDVLRMSIGP
ncbi:MAG TPA: hypothetical protein VGN86_09355 [Pyrinomonadaceae bacterium]|jgi:hypothetical protein|nr:hypothetical protein [Pyrinomonadaceae bacterium]